MNKPHKDLVGYATYLAAERGVAQETFDAYLRDLEMFRVHAADEGYTLHSAPLTSYQSFVRAQSKAGHSSATINRRLASIRSYLEWVGETTGKETDEIVDMLEGPKEEQLLPEILNVEQISSLIEAPDTSTALGLRDRAILELLYATGIRATELCTILLADLNLKEKTVRVKGKGAKERVVPFHKKAAKALEAYLSVREGKLKTLFLSQSERPLERVALWKLLQKYAKKAGIQKECYPHLLRHSFASHMLGGGADLRVIQEVLGHESVNTTQIYTHVDTTRLKKVHALLGR